MSCRGLDSYIVGGISRDRDFLLMLFSFAVSVTNYAFPYMTGRKSLNLCHPFYLCPNISSDKSETLRVPVF